MSHVLRAFWGLVVLALLSTLALPAAASAATVTVGRQNLSTAPDDNLGCSSTIFCVQTVSPTALTTPGDRFVVPDDGVIVRWRVVGFVTHKGAGHGSDWLKVLRPSGGQFLFVSPTVDSAADKYDGTPNIPLHPAAVSAGDFLGLQAFVDGGGEENSAAVYAVHATGAPYNLFGPVTAGDVASPTSVGHDLEPLFNADVALDPPVVSALSPGSGSTAGGQAVTITGDHLADASEVKFGGLEATSVSAISNSTVTAVTPRSAAGTVDVTVKTLGGTSAASAAGRFTYVATGQRAAALKKCKKKYGKARKKCKRKANLLPE